MIKLRAWCIAFAILTAVLVPLWQIIAALGFRFDVWDISFAMRKMSVDLWTYVRYASIGAGLIALALSGVLRPRHGIGVAAGLAALIIPIVANQQSERVFQLARSLPAIHDISTDRVDPPMFTETVMALRDAEDSNPAYYVGKVKKGWNGEPDQLVSDLQAEAYPDLLPISTERSPEEAFDRSRELVRDFGWDIQTQDRENLLIEATATTFWYGFKDDVIIRIRPDDGGSIVDVRSLSRFGGSDFGKNADRIRKFRDRGKWS